MRVNARVLEIAEGQVGVERSAVRRPARRVGPGRCDFPSGLADVAALRVVLPIARAQHAVRRIGFPVKVGGEVGQAAETPLAFAQGRFGDLALAQRPVGARLHGGQAHEAHERRFAEIALGQELERAAVEGRVAQSGIAIGGDDDHGAADRLHQALDGRGAAGVRQVQVGDDEVDVAFREQRERVGGGACAVELHIGERDAAQVRADDLDADRVVFEQQDAHRLGKRWRALDEFRTRLQDSSPGESYGCRPAGVSGNPRCATGKIPE